MSIIAARFLDDIYDLAKEAKVELAPLQVWRVYLRNPVTNEERELDRIETRAEYPDILKYGPPPWGWVLSSKVI